MKSIEMNVKFPIRNRFTAKDQAKADAATRFWGEGPGSTGIYREICHRAGYQTDHWAIHETDIVFFSVNGTRPGRVPPSREAVEAFALAGATVLTDTPAHRVRTYNIGERELAMLLEAWDYKEHVGQKYSTWRI